jgi:ribonucleoside-triphosphate reductase
MNLNPKISEIILRPFSFCNLTEAVVRSDDTLSTLSDKVRIASILGTLQSTCTNFKYLRQRWKTNCDEERLLGVSLTGIYDNYLGLMVRSDTFKNLKEAVIDTNKEWAEKLGINQSTATTCVKPSGTVSELVNASSGMHPRWAPYYIRTVRADNKDPLTQFMKEQGIPNEPAIGKELSTTVFSFPKKSPLKSVVNEHTTAVGHLFDYRFIQDHWCEHKPSVTINVKETEWLDVAAHVYDDFNEITGVSFLPANGEHVYKQAPFQTCTEEEYLAAVSKMPQKLDWSKLQEYEKGIDTTTSSQELACTGGVCAIVDVGS